MERFNRHHIMFAVLGAAGLALAVDKFVLGGGLTAPASASASTSPAPASANVVAGEPAKAGQQPEKPHDSTSKLDAWSRTQRSAQQAGGALAEQPKDAMRFPGWATTRDGKQVTPGALGRDAKGGFYMSGVAKNSIRLKREGESDASRGQLLIVGRPAIVQGERRMSVTLVSVTQDLENGLHRAVIDVDGERREITSREASKGSMDWNAPLVMPR